MVKCYFNFFIFVIDIDKECIDYVNKECLENGLKNINFFYIFDGKLLDDWKEMFDFIIMNDVFYDLFDVDVILIEIKRVFKFDGFVVVYDLLVLLYYNKVINNRMV